MKCITRTHTVVATNCSTLFAHLFRFCFCSWPLGLCDYLFLLLLFHLSVRCDDFCLFFCLCKVLCSALQEPNELRVSFHFPCVSLETVCSCSLIHSEQISRCPNAYQMKAKRVSGRSAMIPSGMHSIQMHDICPFMRPRELVIVGTSTIKSALRLPHV